jgi:phage terminase large subunit
MGAAEDLSPAILRAAATRIQRDPVFHIEKIQGVSTLEDYQRRICRAIVDHQRVAISACHDVGKSFTMSKIVLWFASSFPGAKVITTAPTFNQVEKILWSEINSGFKRSKVPLGGEMLQTQWKIDSDWFAIGLSPRKEANTGSGQGTASSFQGYHAPYILVVFDEATGIPPQIWNQAEGLLTSGFVRFAAIGNPTSKSADFYKCFTSPAWKKIRLSCFDSPNLIANGITNLDLLREEVERVRGMNDEAAAARLAGYKNVQPVLLQLSWVVAMGIKWGLDHPLFVSKVLGDFPEEDENVLIPLGLVERAQLRTQPQGAQQSRAIGVDPARFGSDSTEITVLEGPIQTARKAMSRKDTAEVTGELVHLINGLPRMRREVVAVDGTGIGAGVVDQLRERQSQGLIPPNVTIREIHFGQRFDWIQDETEKRYCEKHYANLKAKIFFDLAASLKSDLCLAADSVYAEQLPTVLYKFDSQGRYVIESKDDYKKRTGLPSPDAADSLGIANFARVDTGGVSNFDPSFADIPAGAKLAPSMNSGDLW